MLKRAKNLSKAKSALIGQLSQAWADHFVFRMSSAGVLKPQPCVGGHRIKKDVDM